MPNNPVHEQRRPWIVKAQAPNSAAPGKFIQIEMEVDAVTIVQAIAAAHDFPGGNGEVFVYSATTKKPNVPV